LLDEVLVAHEVRAQCPDCRADSHAEYRDEKENPEQHPPESAIQGCRACEARVLARLGTFLAGRPGNDGGILDLQQLLLL